MPRYSVAQAAKIVGKSRPTIYRHIDTKPISVEKDEDGNQFIDAAELLRVYGNNINFKAVDEKGAENITEKILQNVIPRDSDPVTSMDDKIKIVKLEAKVENLESQLETKEHENDYVKGLLEEEKTERKIANNLLEDQRERTSRDDVWKSSLRAMEQRLSNTEKTVKEESEHLKMIQVENKILKKALKTEKNKTLFQKIFPKKKQSRRKQSAA